MKTGEKKGISLIVLIITIVVMVILAGAIILTLTDDDIINNSKDAVENSDFSNLKEAAQTQYGSWQLAKQLKKTDKEAEEYVKDKLREQGVTEQELKGVAVTDESGLEVYAYPEIPEGFTASIYQGEDTVPGGLVIYKTDEATLATKTQAVAQTTYDQFVWVPVPDIDKFERTGWKNNAPTNTLNYTFYTEPSSYNGSTANQYPNEVAEYNAMKASVEKYGGFYIARYEAGDGDVTTARTDSTITVHTVVSRKEAFVYNYVGWGASMTDITSDVITITNYNIGKGAVYLAQNMYSTNNNYVTHLIYGVQWDATMRWLSDKYDVTDSKSWGNYKNSTGDAAINSGYGYRNYTTGRNEAWKSKNIYDLAGNIYEWTMEAAGGTNRVLRGGWFDASAIDSFATMRTNTSNRNGGDYFGFRPVLYLK